MNNIRFPSFIVQPSSSSSTPQELPSLLERFLVLKDPPPPPPFSSTTIIGAAFRAASFGMYRTSSDIIDIENVVANEMKPEDGSETLVVFLKGTLFKTLRGEHVLQEFLQVRRARDEDTKEVTFMTGDNTDIEVQLPQTYAVLPLPLTNQLQISTAVRSIMINFETKEELTAAYRQMMEGKHTLRLALATVQE